MEPYIADGAMGSYSPDTPPTRVAYWKDEKFWVRELKGGGERDLPSLEGATVLKWSPDSQRIVYLKTGFVSRKSSIEALKLDDNTTTVLWNDPGGEIMDFVWTPDDRLIYTQAAASEESTYLWEMHVDAKTAQPTEAPRKLWTWVGSAPGAISVSHDGKRIVTTKSSYETDVYVAPLERSGQLGQEKQVTKDIRTDLLAGWTPDGEILFISQRDSGYNVYRQGKSAQTAVPLVQGKDARAPQITPDGQSLLYMVWPDPKLPGPVRIERVPVVRSGSIAEPLFDARVSPGEKTFSPGDVPNLQAKSPQRFPDIRCPSKAGTTAACLLAEAYSGEVVFTSFDPILRVRIQVVHRVGAAPSKFFWDLSPDGSRLAYGEFSLKDDGITVFSLKDQRTRIVPGTKRPRLSSLSWSIDEQSLFVTTSLAEGSDLLHVPLEGKAVPLRQRQPGRWISNPRPSPDGLHLAYDVQTIDSNVWLIEPKMKK